MFRLDYSYIPDNLSKIRNLKEVVFKLYDDHSPSNFGQVFTQAFYGLDKESRKKLLDVLLDELIEAENYYISEFIKQNSTKRS